MNVTLGEWEGKEAAVRSQCAWQAGLALLVSGEGLFHCQAHTGRLDKLLSQDAVQSVQWLVSDGAQFWGYSLSRLTLQPDGIVFLKPE